MTHPRRDSLTTGLRLEHRRRSSFAPPHIDSTKMWSNTVGKSVGLIPGRSVLGPLFLISVCPTFVMVLHHILVDLDGSMVNFWHEIRGQGLVGAVWGLWPTWKDPFVWKMIGIFISVELGILILMPGRQFRGPVTPGGNVPTYTANGLQAYFLSLILFLLGWYCGLYKGGILYDNLGKILSSMNVFALSFCFLLYLKGLFLPSSSDHGSSGNPIFDYYWGTELYPRILGWDVKQFTNCRCGMMFWALFLVSAALKQLELQGQVSNPLLVNVGLQLVYITKFYWWESGYLCSMDIMHDRAGFYICWGVLVFLPCVYTSHTAYLVSHPAVLIGPMALAVFALGLLLIYVNYDCDRQRQEFRAAGGNMKIWGKDPVFMEAKYKTESGEKKTSLLLASGWWGMARHFHYLPEIAAATCWTVMVSSHNFLPYFYIPSSSCCWSTAPTEMTPGAAPSTRKTGKDTANMFLS